MSLPLIAGTVALLTVSVPQPAQQDTIAPALARRGGQLFQARGCVACHEVGPNRRVGPGLLGVTERRSYRWFEGMVSRPDSMIREDAAARNLFAEYRTPMPNLSVAKSDIEAIWAYLGSEATTGSAESDEEGDVEGDEESESELRTAAREEVTTPPGRTATPLSRCPSSSPCRRGAHHASRESGERPHAACTRRHRGHRCRERGSTDSGS